MTSRRLAGLAGLAFPALVVAALSIADAQAGSYHAAAIIRFTQPAHRNAVLVSFALIALATAALTCLVGYLMNTYVTTGWHARIVWSAAVVSVGAFLIGWVVTAAPSITVTLGGGPAIQPGVAYTFLEAGVGIFLIGGLALGVALMAMAHGAQTMPGWMRILTGLIGALGLLSLAFEPFLGILLWSLTTGIWLIASKPARASAGSPEHRPLEYA